MSDTPHLWPAEYAAAALLLLKAWDFAEHEGRSVWDFAVELEDLRRVGLSRADLRRLICRGLLEHADEIVGGAGGVGAGRTFQRAGRLALGVNSCFVLTEGGRGAALQVAFTSASPAASVSSPAFTNVSPVISEAAEGLSDARASSSEGNGEPSGSNGNGHAAEHLKQLKDLKPVWDADLNRLTLGDVIVKEYRTPAPNQQLILAAFQEEGWPPRIDDPLPPHPEQDARRRLHETIVSLNRNQKSFMLKFGGDGNGQGILWKPIHQ